MSQKRDGVYEERVHRSTRRRLLAGVGVAVGAGVAGCLGGGDDNGSSGDGGSGGDGSDDGDGEGGGNAIQTCSDIGSGFLRFDPGERPFVYRCDYPEVFGEQSSATPGFEQEGWFLVQLESSDQDGDSLQLDLECADFGQTKEQVSFGEYWEELTQTEFNGETVTAMRDADSVRNQEFWAVYLPYEIDGRTLYFEAEFNLNPNPADDGDVSDECVSILEETAVAMTKSLEYNPDATDLEAGPLVPTATDEG